MYVIKKQELPKLLHKILIEMGGQGEIVSISKLFWDKYEKELRESFNLFYTWQYDIRWAATKLRKMKIMVPANISPKGFWELYH